MSDKKSLLDKIPFIAKLKKIKGFEYVVIGIIFVLVLIIYFAAHSSPQSTSDSNQEHNNSAPYAKELENKLCNVLSQIAGAGKVSAMVTLESGGEIVVATSTEERVNTSSGSSNSTQSNTKVESPVIVNNSPLVVMEYYPKIKGVVIVAQGAKDVKVRLELLKAVQTLIDIDASHIEILAGN